MNALALFRQDLILAGLLVTIIILMVVPLPQPLIDVFIALNISLAILMLMVSIYLKRPSDFSTFPTVILIGTAFRLSISIATTRLILTDADAGQIIETFGIFVIKGSVIVGLVIFLIITTVQFIVITRGAERVAEVAARFALDAMPGKQMSIDAEMRAGTIDQEEGNLRRQQLDKDNQFFGAMDGAMKFVKGDAIAGLVIIAVNLIGGIAVGMLVHEYSLSKSLEVFTILTIGDGLVAQIPALFMSMCSGAIITRVTHEKSTDLGTEISHQLGTERRALYVAAVVVLGLGFVPGFPSLIFIVVAACLGLLGWFFSYQVTEKADDTTEKEDISKGDETETEEVTVELRETDRLVLFLGSDIYDAFEKDGGKQHRDQMCYIWQEKSGISWPAFSISKVESLPSWDMEIKFDTVPFYTAAIPENHVFINAEPNLKALLPSPKQPDNKWPGEQGFWIASENALKTEELKAQVVPMGHAVSEAVMRVAERQSGELFSRVELRHFCDAVKEKDPVMVEDVFTAIQGTGLFTILQDLAQDGVPLVPQRTVMEVIYQWLQKTKDPATIVEAVRMKLRRQICHSLADRNGVIAVIPLATNTEAEIRKSLQAHFNPESVAGTLWNLGSQVSDEILAQFHKIRSSRLDHGRHLVVVTAPDIRRIFRNFLSINGIHYPVLSYQEIAPELSVHPIEIIRLKTDKNEAA